MYWPLERIWPSRAKREASCGFCQRSYLVAGPLVEGRRQSLICEPCTQRAQKALAAGAAPLATARCTFGRHARSWTPAVVRGTRGEAICQDCAEIAVSIFAHHQLVRASELADAPAAGENVFVAASDNPYQSPAEAPPHPGRRYSQLAAAALLLVLAAMMLCLALFQR